MTNEEFKRIAFKYDGEGKPVTFGSRGVPQSSQQQIFLHELVHATLDTRWEVRMRAVKSDRT